jgi:hypothetical protein
MEPELADFGSGFWSSFCINVQRCQRPKLSRAAVTVNRECGIKGAIGGGSGELLGDSRFCFIS